MKMSEEEKPKPWGNIIGGDVEPDEEDPLIRLIKEADESIPYRAGETMQEYNDRKKAIKAKKEKEIWDEIYRRRTRVR